MAGKAKPSKEQIDALEQEVKLIENEFTVDVGKLRDIADALKVELGKGLSSDPGSVPLFPTWVIGAPTGREKGTYIGIDLGRTIKGTNLRICEVQFLQSKGQFDITQSSFRVPEKVRVGTSDQLAEFVANCLQSFRQQIDSTAASHIAVTFSFPVEQENINEARLIRWLRGFDVKDAIGKDVVAEMQKGIDAKNIPLKIVGVLNDSVGTLIASAYADPGIKIGAIFGTGSSVAFFEECGKIEKLAGQKIDPKTLMAINCQWGEFNGDVLPLTKYDKQLDPPGEHTFEKLLAGLWLPEILRLILLELKNKSLIFKDSDCKKIEQPYALDIAVMRTIESDPYGNMFDTEEVFREKLGIRAHVFELKMVQRIVTCITDRAAGMIAAGLVGLYKHLGEPSPFVVGADGSMFILYPGFRKRIHSALAAIREWPADRKHDPIAISFAQDGNGVGAALIGGMTISRAEGGDTFGIKNPESLMLK